MSRIGRMPIAVPAGVDVKIDGSTVTVKGPKGTLTRTVNSTIKVELDNGVINVTRPDDSKECPFFREQKAEDQRKAPCTLLFFRDFLP